MKPIVDKRSEILHEFGACNPAVSYTNGVQSYIGIIGHFELEKNILRIYFKWIIFIQQSSQTLFLGSIAKIEDPEIKKVDNTMTITHKDGTITVTNLGSVKFSVLQAKLQYDKSNHH